EQLPEARGRLSPQGPAAVPVHRTQDRYSGVLPPAPARSRVLLRVVRRQFHLPRPDPLRRRRRQYRHRAAARAAGSRRGGQVLERGAVRQERWLPARRAHRTVGVRGLSAVGPRGLNGWISWRAGRHAARLVRIKEKQGIYSTGGRVGAPTL